MKKNPLLFFLESRVRTLVLLLGVVFIAVSISTAATPNPGHPWTQIGDGLVQFSTPTGIRTYTLPDANSTLFGPGSMAQGDLFYASSSSMLGIALKSYYSRTFGTTGPNPRGVTVDSSGNVYIVNSYANNVTKITPAGVSSTLGTTGSSPYGITIDSSGNVYTANTTDNTVTKITPAGVSSTLGTTGLIPSGITIDSSGNVYTANFSANNVTKITPAGVSSTLGTTGNGPRGITIDSSGNVYTANNTDNTVTKITPAGVSSTLGTTDSGAYGITIDSSGNVYTANTTDNTVTKITPAGVSSTLGTTGSSPYGITIDSSGNVYTTNYSANTVTKITPAGVSSTLGTTGSNPTGITLDSSGNVFVANSNSYTVTKITPYEQYLSNTGTNNNPAWSTINLTNGISGILASANGGTGNASTSFTGQTLARTYTLPDANATILTSNSTVTLAQGGTGASALLYGLLTKMQNSIFSALLLSSNGCTSFCPIMSTTTVNGTNPVSYDFGGSGAGTVGGLPYPSSASYRSSTIFASLGRSSPSSIAIDSSGNLYTANSGFANVTKITPGGATSTLGTTDFGPQNIAVDSLGNVYTANNFGTVSKITSGGATSTIDVGASFYNLQGITVDSSNNVYVINSSSNIVSKITSGGATSTLGTTGTSPYCIAVDSSGNVYTGNSGSKDVTKITSGGVSSTLASSLGDNPRGIAVDSSGNVYVTVTGLNIVLKITPGGATSTLGTAIYPQGVAVDSFGNVYTPNYISGTITKITSGGVSSTINSPTGMNAFGIVLDSSGNVYTANYGTDNVTKVTAWPTSNLFDYGYMLNHSSTTASLDQPVWGRMSRTMSAYVDAGATTITNMGFPAAPTTSGVLTSSSTTEGSFLVSTGSTSGTALGVISPAFTYARRDWNPYLNTNIITATTSLATARYWIGLTSAAPTTAAPNIHLAAFRYDPAVDGTAFWRAVTIAGTGASANVITTTSAITTGTTYEMNIGCTSSLCSFYINGSLVATSSTALPALGTPLGYVAQVTPTAAVFRSIGWSRLSLTHK